MSVKETLTDLLEWIDPEKGRALRDQIKAIHDDKEGRLLRSSVQVYTNAIRQAMGDTTLRPFAKEHLLKAQFRLFINAIQRRPEYAQVQAIEVSNTHVVNAQGDLVEKNPNEARERIFPLEKLQKIMLGE
jgi:hypothetical protein